jgi:hypothetical protein
MTVLSNLPFKKLKGHSNQLLENQILILPSRRSVHVVPSSRPEIYKKVKNNTLKLKGRSPKKASRKSNCYAPLLAVSVF